MVSRPVADLPEPLRVALLAGTLNQGGAEKQLVYLARALSGAGVDVRIYCLTRGDFYEGVLQAIGLKPIWVGRFANPMLRLASLAGMLWRFRPHVIQSSHSFTNLYVSLTGRLLGAISLGAMRSSLLHTREANGAWTRWLISTPTALLVNSQTAVDELIKSRLIHPQCLSIVPNVIELSDSDSTKSPQDGAGTVHHQTCKAIFVGRLIPVKRLDRFLYALAKACQQHPALEGIVVGDGPGRKAMEKLATEIGLWPHKVTFLGQRGDVSALLSQSNMLVLCSDHEGFPNVVLEAMAERLPVITTPAGDADIIVQDGVTGYVVPFDDIDGMAERMVHLAKSPSLRRQLGEAGRRRVERSYSFEGLSDRLLSIYRRIAQQLDNRRVMSILGAMTPVP